ncbi:MAG: helix-turn-helix transcriptional regulator [Alistipes sp.]|nr:helix-turn-helix transcriptional regulator [Alistipes sp.]
MDILRKELNAIYSSQRLDSEALDVSILDSFRSKIEAIAPFSSVCYVITDASADSCYIYAGSFARLLGISADVTYAEEYGSSDEDVIYNCIHPEDLVEKRMLEYDYFRYVDSLSAEDKLHYVACCRLRMRGSDGIYRYIYNTTRILQPSPKGRIWLIICSYELSSDQTPSLDITPKIINIITGQIEPIKMVERRARLLSEREKQILTLIREGMSSKQIADLLSISIHTVNRHRQNILEKLSVGNTYEAITAAMAMRLL